MLNTTGTVLLGPETRVKDPLYAGFTIFQDRDQVVDPPTFSPTAYGAAQTLAARSRFDEQFNVNGESFDVVRRETATTASAICPGNVISIGTAPNER